MINAMLSSAEHSAIGTFDIVEAVLVLLLLLVLTIAHGTRSLVPALAEDPRLAALARTGLRSAMTVIAAGLVLRGVMLALLPPPVAIVPDEFSLMLQAQTFAAGRLANPAHPLGAFFETLYVNQVPAYASMYFPGRSLPLLIGMVTFGHPWGGVWLTMLALAVATVWMLRAWVVPPLALVGGLLVILRFGVFSAWINGYYGGTLTALGGVLVIGSFERLRRHVGIGNSMVMAAGVAILLLTRPFEGMLFCLPFAAMGIVWLVRRAPRLTPGARFTLVLPSLLAIAAGGTLIAIHDAATTGSASLTPYELNRRAYAFSPAFLTGTPTVPTRAVPAALRDQYWREGGPFRRLQQPGGIAAIARSKSLSVALFYIGPALAIPFVAGLSAWRRFRVPAAGTVAVLGGFAITSWDWPYYISPAFGGFILVIVLGLERLERSGRQHAAIGPALSRLLPRLVALMLLVPLAGLLAGRPLPYTALRACCVVRTTLDPVAALLDRGPAERRLLATPGRHLVLVRMDPGIGTWVSWVNNGPDIDAGRIIWANDLGPDRDRALLARYPDRRVWTVHIAANEAPRLSETTPADGQAVRVIR